MTGASPTTLAAGSIFCARSRAPAHWRPKRFETPPEGQTALHVHFASLTQ
jgi:hypothetical protein